MKFSLVFDKSGDSIDFDVVYNSDLLEFFIEKANECNSNAFFDDCSISKNVNRLLNELHNSLTLTNSVMSRLINFSFPESHNRLDYLDQSFLNKQHELWVLSQRQEVDIDQLRFSKDKLVSELGWKLHDLYPDEIRRIKLAPAMIKLGYIFPYEEVNLTVHRLENFFAQDHEFKSDLKWQVFDNPLRNSMISNNDIVNFKFGYTYVGRQYYNKWKFFDSDLTCVDHYNYEDLEFAFQLNLDRPETIPYSKEFLTWCNLRKVKPITTQIPIANVIDLEKNLKYYRTILYKNSLEASRVSIKIH